MQPLVSVVIPTTDKEKEILNETVAAVKRSTYKHIELVIVNEGKERSEQRNIGIKRAKGEFLLILDSDQIIEEWLIKECVQHCVYFDCLYIPERIVTKGFFGYLRNWERQFYTGTDIDVVRFVRAQMCPMFDITMSGPEDSDWDRRIGGKRTTTWRGLDHKDNVGFIKYLQKKAYYSKSMKRYAEKWPNDKCLNFWWRFFGVYFEDGKWKRIIMRPDLFSCIIGLNFLRGIIYLWTTWKTR